MTELLVYLKAIKKIFKIRKYRSFHKQQLFSIDSMEEFLSYVERTKPDTFLEYKDMSNEKRKDFIAVIDYLKINLMGQNILDIGPGYGDSLDICYDGGAKSIDLDRKSVV